VARDQRRLAAIVATDVVGYSRLMGVDEEGTLSRLKTHLRDLVYPKIAECRGRTVKTMGDGLLMEFPSVVDAVRCAVDVQLGMAERNADVPGEQQIRFRIGINVGDIIIDGDDIFGDGVNVAARLETLANAGGICVSRVVRDQVQDKVDYAFEDLGAQVMKNIARPVEVYRVALATGPCADTGRQAPGAPTPTIAEPASIAVLPFANRSQDVEDEYFSDGLADEMLNVLAKIDGLRVAARSSAFTFKGKPATIGEVGRALNVATVLEGSVRKAGNRMRISVQLVKVADGYQLWSERYDRTLDDIFAVQDDIAQSVVKALRTTLLGDVASAKTATDAALQAAAAVRSRSTDSEAYRFYLKGREYLVGTQQEMDKSIDFFQQAIARAPDYALAHAGLAEAYTTQAYLRATERAHAVEKARAAVNRALELDPNLAEARTALGLVRFYFEWDWAGADAEFRRALQLNPGGAAVCEEYGRFLLAIGSLDDGLARSRDAARLDPLSVGPVHDIAINAFVRNDYELAAAGFRRAIDINPNWVWGYIKLARALAAQANCAEAIAQAEIAERKIAGGVAPLSQSWLGVTYAMCGDRGRAREKIDGLHDLEKRQYVDPVTFAAVHSALGEMDDALRWYEKAFEDRTPNMVYAAILPRLSPELADNPRYQAIVDRMGLPRLPVSRR
jgi:adenylate cyclase